MRLRRTAELTATLIVAALGGGVAALLDLPVAWLLGSFLAVAAVGALGLDTRLPDWLRDVTFFVLGVQAGAGVTPEVVEQIAIWPASFAIQTLGVLAVVVLTYAFLRRGFGWDRETSLFAALPGAMSFVLAAASETRADMTRLIVVQSTRLLLLIGVLTPALAAIEGGETIRALDGAGEGGAAWQYGLLFLVCLFGSFLGSASRLPGGMMLGALLGSAVLHVTGWAPVALPRSVAIPALVVLGVLIGGRLRRDNRRAFLTLLPASLGAFALGILASAAAGAAAYLLLGIDIGRIALAYAPGALEALTVLAFQFNLDPAYVAAHHVFRFVCIALIVPLLARRLMQAGETEKEGKSGVDGGEDRG